MHVDQFTVFVKREYSEDVPHWIVNLLKELARIDPGSTAFRYGDYNGPLDKTNPPLRD